MKIYKKIRKTIQELATVECNKCGELIYMTGFPDSTDHVSIKHSFGFWCKYDLKSIELDICADCLIKFCKSCKIKPEFKDETI